MAFLIYSVISVYFITNNLRITDDLAYFLPNSNSVEDQVLLHNMGQAAVSKSIIIVSKYNNSEDPVKISESVKSRLEEIGVLESIKNGFERHDLNSIPIPLWHHRHILLDIDTSPGGFKNQIESNLKNIVWTTNGDQINMLTSDPYLIAAEILRKISISTALEMQGWIDQDKKEIYMLGVLKGAAYDKRDIEMVINHIKSSVFRDTGRNPVLYGAGVYSVESHNIIENEVTSRTIIISIIAILVVIFGFGNVRSIFIVVVPVMVAVITSTNVSILLFDEIHGITLAFSITLIGVAFDYPIHILKSRKEVSRRSKVFKTVVVASLSTVLGYLSISLGGSSGIVQLGIFSAVGVATSALISLYIIPHFKKRMTNLNNNGERVYEISFNNRLWPIVVLAVFPFVLIGYEGLGRSNLSEMIPLDEERLLEEGKIGQKLGNVNIRYVAVVMGNSFDNAIVNTEKIVRTLNNRENVHLYNKYLAISTLVPSLGVQERRKEKLNSSNITSLKEVVSSSVYNESTFNLFLDDLEKYGKRKNHIDINTYNNTPLEGFVRKSIFENKNRWHSLVYFSGINNVEKLKTVLENSQKDVIFIDLKNVSEKIVTKYKHGILRVISIMLIISFILLTIISKNKKRVLWIYGNLLAVILLSMAVNIYMQNHFSIINTVALLLVLGISVDYFAFNSIKALDDIDAWDINSSINICFVTTTSAFLILSYSEIGILRDIGITVLSGVLMAYLLSKTGKRYQLL